MNVKRWFFVLVALGLIVAGILGSLNQIALQDRVAKLDREQNAPSILVVCQDGNPEVTITILHAVRNLWLQLLLPSEGKSAIFVFYSQADLGATDVLNGGIGDMRGSEYFALSAGIYTLRGWSSEYTENQPIFRPRDLVFETTFQVPDCSK